MPPEVEHRPSQIALELAYWLVAAYGDRAKEFRDYWSGVAFQNARFVASFGDYCFADEDTVVPGNPDQSNVNAGMRRAYLAFKGMPDVTDQMIDAIIADIERKAKQKPE